MAEIQQKFIQLVKRITELQWVRESLPSHSKNYESLKKKLEKQIHLKNFSERELKAYRLEKDKNTLNSKRNLFTANSNNSNNSNRSYTNMIESVKFYENAIRQIESQMSQTKVMLNELAEEKKRLDSLCTELHLLYDQVIIPDLEDSNYIFEQHLKKDVEQLSVDIPRIQEEIKIYKKTQTKLYNARDLIEKAMKSLPGASTFMDRQAIIASTTITNDQVILTSLSPIKKANEIAQKSYELVKEASELCEDVILIPITIKDNQNVMKLLTHYRGYRLKIEYILRTKLNPKLIHLENHLSLAKFHHEQKLIEWIDVQIISLESYLRLNGLLNENLDRELSRLRMGSRAAIASIATEFSGRVTVDDALEIDTVDSILPQYPFNQHQHNEIPPPTYSRE